MSALVVRDLTVRTALGRTLLEGIDLEIGAGEQVLLVGPSGSGKSTLLRVIAGLDPVPGGTISGSVTLAGRQVLGRDPEEDPPPLDVGWLPQDSAAGVCLPVVEDDVALGCESRAWPVPRIDAAVADALRAVGGWGWRARDSGTLSAGQAQRVGLAAALAPGPAVLLLDEPTALLDPGALRAVQGVVARLQDDAEPPAVLLVEHRLDEWADAGRLPARVVVLDGGRVVADGPGPRVWDQVGAALASSGAHLPWSVELALRGSVPDGGARRRRSTSPGCDAPGETLLRTAGLAVGHTDAALSGVELSVGAGEVVAVVGANGAGKTTLLHTLAGVMAPRAGTIERPGGRPALVFGDPEQQFLAPTVAAELGFDGAPADVVEATVAALRLDPATSVHRLSGGEQRRLSVASVLQGVRRVVLLDEPTRSLDRQGVRWAVRVLRSSAAAGRGILLTSHDLRFVLDVADRVHVIDGGRLLGGGPPQEVLASDLLGRAGLPVPSSVRWLLSGAAA